MCYFAFFLVEFLVRLVGEHAWGFWRSSWFWFDLLLAVLCVVEARGTVFLDLFFQVENHGKSSSKYI